MRRGGICSLHHVQQGEYGATARKPTGLLALRMNHLLEDMQPHKRRPSEPWRTAIGLAADGSFKTAALKEYPHHFCVALANGIHAELCRRVQQGCQGPEAPLEAATEARLRAVARASREIREDATFLPDLQL